MTYREATVEDAAEISALVSELAEKFIAPDYSATGAAVLLSSMGVEETLQRMNAGFHMRVAVDNGRIVGVIVMMTRGHLYHLFVAESHQRRGIGRHLWELGRDEALALGNPGRITVKSSRYAVPVYRRLGFVEDGGVYEQDEVTCQPMVWNGRPMKPADESPK